MFSNNFRQDVERKPYNLVRILEWILCAICLSLAIYILVQVRPLHKILTSLFILVATAYFFITLVDIIVTCLLKPLFWTSWIVFALMAALAFFLCTGLLITPLHPLTMALHIITVIANGITGFVFLLEILYIISRLLNNTKSVESVKEPTVSKISQSTSTTPATPCNEIVTKEDKANQFSGNDLHFMGNNKSVQCPSNAFLRRGKFTCIKDTCPKKCTYLQVPSHGGTFHVSKDVVPLLCSSPLRTSRTSSSSGSPPRKSPKIELEPDSNIIACQKCRDEFGNIIEEALSVKSRTVSTSARMVSKQNPETTYSITVKSAPPCANDFMQKENDASQQQGTNQIMRQFCRPLSSPAYNQTTLIPSTVQQYHSCAYYGEVHQNNATAQQPTLNGEQSAVQQYQSHTYCGEVRQNNETAQQPTSNREANNMYRCHRLPTLQENSCYSPTDEPTKDPTCYPYSPTTSSANKSYSGTSMNTSRIHTPNISSNHSSPRFCSPLINRSTLERTATSETCSTQPFSASSLTHKSKDVFECFDNQPVLPQYSEKKFQNCFGKAEPQQPSYSNKSSKCATGAGEASKSGSLGADAVFRFEPHCKTKEIQTQPYKTEQQNEYTECDDCYSKPSNYFSYSEPYYCLCEAQEVELKLANYHQEEDTVLPGAADRSPRNDVSAERYVVIHPVPQQSTVIDINDDSPGAPIAYLVPTKCYQLQESERDAKQTRTKLQKTQEKCTVM